MYMQGGEDPLRVDCSLKTESECAKDVGVIIKTSQTLKIPSAVTSFGQLTSLRPCTVKV